MKGYCTKEDVENFLLTDVDASFEPQIEKWIGQMEEYIDRITGRNFIASGTETNQWYDGTGTKELEVNENIEIVQINLYDIDGQATDTLNPSDIFILPYNEKPIRKIRIKPSVSKLFNEGERNVKVNAKWGYSTNVPAPITFATSVLVAGIVNFGNDAGGEIKAETIGEYSVTYKDDNDWNNFREAMKIIRSFKKGKRYV